MKLSIVATLYNTGCYLDEFYNRISVAAKKITADYEIVLVNDGSPDDALEKAIALSAHDASITVVDLSRNFGHHRAIMAGLGVAQGDFVFLIDSDLEEPPEVLEAFYRRMSRHDCDVVYGYQQRRRGRWFDRVTGSFYYWLVNFVADIDLPKNLVTTRLMTRRYVTSLLLHREREMFIAGLWSVTGYRQVGLPVEKLRNSPTSYGFWRRVSILSTSIISFSEKPLALAALLGGFITICASGVIVWLIAEQARFRSVPGWTSVIASVWLLGGLIIFFIGLIGLYVAKIFVEVKQRPYVIVRETYRLGKSDTSSGQSG
jgi:putative glycosyltransferase